MRILKTFFGMILAASFMVACSGGGGSEDAASSSGNTDLYVAFDKINAGMNYDQVKAIVGYDHNAGKDDFGSEIHYKWDSNKGTLDYTLLSVTIEASGVTGKIVVGSKGNNSKFY